MKKTLILLLISIFYLSAFAQQYIISFDINDKNEIQKLPKYISVDNVKDNHVRAYIWGDKNMDDFKSLGYEYEFLDHPSKDKVINMATTTAQMANWDRYPTYEVYVQMMNDFVTNYPDLCQLVNIGTTQQGRQLLAIKISDNVSQHEQEPEYFYTSTMHGDETTGFVLLLRLADWLLSNYGIEPDATFIVNNFELYINPLANPDGTYHGGNSTVSGAIRGYYNGDDPNRDFPYPLNANPSSNPETNAMIDFAEAHHFVMSANFHGGAEVMNYPWDCWTSSENSHADNSWFVKHCTDYVQSARTIDANFMKSVTSSGVTEGADWYYAFGSRQDYMTYFRYGREICIEISDTKLLSSSDLPTWWNINKESLINFIKPAIYGFNGTVKNEQGEPLNAKIYISSHDDDNDHSEVYTDPVNGDYYRPIAPGTYNVTYSSEGYISQTHSVTVSDWYSTTIKDVILIQSPQTSLTGTVIDATTGEHLENVRISFPGTSIDDQYTNAYGEYSLTLSQNEYDIVAYKNGYAKQTKTLTLTGTNNTVDFALIPTTAITFEENIPSEITLTGDANWFRTNTNSYEGDYSMQSGDINHNQQSIMTLTVTTEAGNISFYKKVSCEDGPNNNWDYLLFEIDGTEKGRWDGEVDWSEESYSVSAGSHTFRWTYKKDGSVSNGSDCAWVDYIELPVNAPAIYSVTFTVLNQTNSNPIENANVSLIGYGTKTTNSSGQCIFNSVYETIGSLSYSIWASGFNSKSGQITVTGNTTETVYLSNNVTIDENSDFLSIYPNPSDGIFNVKTNSNDGYIIIYNSIGVEIEKVPVNGNLTKINITKQEKGVYFVQHLSSKGMTLQKTIIE